MAVLLLPALLMLLGSASGEPQTRLLNQGCRQYNATDPAAFVSDLDATLDDIRSQVGGNASRSPFATAQSLRGSDPVYVLFQCRDYLSSADCAACFANASTRIRRCAAANGARVVYDGCFLRYESSAFFDQQECVQMYSHTCEGDVWCDHHFCIARLISLLTSFFLSGCIMQDCNKSFKA